jgi:hypothetical protein
VRGAAERTASPRRERHEEAMDVALSVCSNETGGFSSPNLLRFPIDVNRSSLTALGLYDCGASNKFVSKRYIANSTEKIKAPFGNPKNNSDFAWFFANRRCGSRSLEARRNDRLATLRAISKINDLTWFLVQKRGKKKVALSYFFFCDRRDSQSNAPRPPP